MTVAGSQIEERMARLHAHGLVDLHFDLLMDLYEKRTCPNVLANEFLPEFEAGNIGVLGTAIYIEDRYLPEMALRVALEAGVGGEVHPASFYSGSDESFAHSKSHPKTD